MINAIWWMQCDEFSAMNAMWQKQYDELRQWMQFNEYIEFYMMKTNSLWLMQYD